MIELEQNKYYKAVPILETVTFNNFFARVVVENKVNGRVFVDSEKAPSVCLIIHKYGMSLLCGNDENDFFNSKLIGFLKSDSTNNTAKWMLTYPEARWESKLGVLLGSDILKVPEIKEEELQEYKKSKVILQTQRVNFKFDVNLFKNRVEIPSGFELKRIDAEIYKKIKGSVVPQNFWNRSDDFLENGIGFSLLQDGYVVSACFASFIVGNKLELGVETDDKFRGHGYSIYPVSALIAYCLNEGYEPIWACRKENISSFKLAAKAGFSPFSYHPYYTIPVNPA